GYIRLQTQGSGNQPESSQYSRTVTNVSSINCPPSVEIDLRAWRDVPPSATSHDAILASSAEELHNHAHLVSGTVVWFTYTVRNPSGVRLEDVEVRDSGQGQDPVCVIPSIPARGWAGCARSHLIQ
ncbi:MAG: hypothetical protein LBC97_02680, partial [Bifidobacteriaceae bacterium]|nr:hypothetical protein [Bifidobacteriaceae bacterium]